MTTAAPAQLDAQMLDRPQETVEVTFADWKESLARRRIDKWSAMAKRHGQVLDVVGRRAFTRPHWLLGPTYPIAYVTLSVTVPPFVGERGQVLAHYERSEDGLKFYAHVFAEDRKADIDACLPRLGTCDHCNTSRMRNNLYICQTADGVKVIGSDCVKDYLGIDPKWLIQGAGALKELSRDWDAEDEQFAWPKSGSRVLLSTVFLNAYKVAKFHHGYSHSVRETVRREASVLCFGGNGEEDRKILATYREFVCEEPDLESFVAYLKDVRSDFGENLRTAMEQQWVVKERLNLIVAGVGGWVGKTLETETRKAALADLPPAKLLDGKEGQRLDFVGTVLRTTPHMGDFGESLIVAIVTDDGSRVVNYTTGQSKPVAGERYAIRATIKRHGVNKRDQFPETTVSRATYAPVGPLQPTLI